MSFGLPTDLIFGCKQQGHGAVDAYNVFHYLFYEGNVDIFRSVSMLGMVAEDKVSLAL